MNDDKQAYIDKLHDDYKLQLAAKDDEIARLKSFNENQSAVNRDLLTELVSSKAEIARLRRDNDRLNTFAMQFCEWDDASHPDTHLRIKDEYNPALYQKQKDEIARLTKIIEEIKHQCAETVWLKGGDD